MALLFETSKCPICNKEIHLNDEIISFPAFVANANDPLIIVNDSGVHQFCLNKHSLSDKAIGLLNKCLEKSPPNRRCDISGNEIQNYEDCVFINVLTSDENEYLYRFNCMVFDKSNFKTWALANDFLEALIRYDKSGKWKDTSPFKYLENLIQILRDCQ